MNERKININQSVSFFDTNLGLLWLKESLKKLKGAQGGKVSFGCGIDTDLTKAEVSYVAYLWYRAQEEMGVAKISGQNFPGPYSLATAMIGIDLETLRHCPGFEKKVSELKQFNLPKRVIFELGIASGYVRAGYPITFTDNGIILEMENVRVKGIVVVLEPEKFTPVILAGETSQYQHILYLHLDDNCVDKVSGYENHLGLVNKEVQQLVGTCHCTVVVCWTGIKKIDSRLAIVRKGWIHKTTGLLFKDVYVPNEIIIPDG